MSTFLCPHRQNGFTLVEVIIALMVAGLSLGSLFMVYHIGTVNSAILVEAQRADMLAASYAEELLYTTNAEHLGASEAIDSAKEFSDAESFVKIDCREGAVPRARSDQPPKLFGQPYTGADDIYARYRVDLDVQCVQPFSSRALESGLKPDIQKLSMKIIAPSGQIYEYALFGGLP